MVEEMKGKDGEVKVSVNENNESKDMTNLSSEQVQQLVDSINKSLENAMTTVNESLTNILGGLDLNSLKSETSKKDLSKLIKSSSISNVISKIKPSNLKDKLPVLETTNEKGNFKVHLNEKKILEIDLSNLKSKE
ncbi:hypothetical protein ACQKP0_11900 [Heyndrickxia sp. NPDC080065]|uniref:hypothetical protein n=1 Tax=Heyndrickxia sp. NPDC080065 TaxID=3390568 RepID=UPI003D01E22C